MLDNDQSKRKAVI